jgi:hypothetical protein
MERIFSSIKPGFEVREWGMGRIYNLKGVTTLVGHVFDFFAKPS